MGKCTTKSYIITLRMYPNNDDLIILGHRFNIVHHITNVVVKHAKKCIQQLERDKTYKDLISKKKLNKEEKQILTDLRLKYGLSEYQFHSYINKQKYMYSTHLDIHTCQKIATKVWTSVSRYLFKDGEKIHFKKKKDINSFEGKSNTTGIRYKDGYIIHNGLKIKVGYKKNDDHIKYALLNDRIKYCRIKRKWHKHNYRYHVDLIMEGIPYKYKVFNSNDKVGIDIGPSTIAVVSSSKCMLQELGNKVNDIERELFTLNRKLDRQRRANNPQNYDEDGTIKKDTKNFKKYWYKSKRMKLTEHKIKELYQKRSNQLRQSHINLANEILSLGTNIIVEDMQWSALAKKAKKIVKNDKGRYKKKKRFGKSIANHAPSMLIEIIKTKLSYLDKDIIKADCFKTAATKYNHVTGELMDVSLKDRYIFINDIKIQRDLHSAFNLRHVIVHKGKKRKDDTYEYDVTAMNDNFANFIKNHNILLDELTKQKHLGHKFPRCMAI